MANYMRKNTKIIIFFIVGIAVLVCGCNGGEEPNVGTLTIQPIYIAPVEGCQAKVLYHITPYNIDRTTLLTVTDPNGLKTKLSNRSNSFEKAYSGDSSVFNNGNLPGFYTFTLSHDGKSHTESVYVIKSEGEMISVLDQFKFPEDWVETKRVDHSFLITEFEHSPSWLEKYEMTKELVICVKYMTLTGVEFLRQPNGGEHDDEISVAVVHPNGRWIEIGELTNGAGPLMLDNPIVLEEGSKIHVTQYRESPSPDYYHGEWISWELGLYFKGI